MNRIAIENMASVSGLTRSQMGQTVGGRRKRECHVVVVSLFPPRLGVVCTDVNTAALKRKK